MRDLDYKLKIHLVRGMLDGDGSLSFIIKKRKEKRDYKEFALSYYGNYILVNFVKEFIDQTGIASPRKIFKTKNKTNSYYIHLQGNRQIKAFLDLLYKDADKTCYLERKYKQYLELCNFVNGIPANSFYEEKCTNSII